jgi:hypothetical protein
MSYEEPTKEENDNLDQDDDLKSLDDISIDDVALHYGEDEYEETDIEGVGPKSKVRPSDHESLKARRALEELLENKKLRKEIDYLYDDNFMDEDDDDETSEDKPT